MEGWDIVDLRSRLESASSAAAVRSVVASTTVHTSPHTTTLTSLETLLLVIGRRRVDTDDTSGIGHQAWASWIDGVEDSGLIQELASLLIGQWLLNDLATNLSLDLLRRSTQNVSLQITLLIVGEHLLLGRELHERVRLLQLLGVLCSELCVLESVVRLRQLLHFLLKVVGSCGGHLLLLLLLDNGRHLAGLKLGPTDANFFLSSGHARL